MLRNEILQKFIAETLPPHLKSSPAIRLAHKVISELEPGMVLDTRTLLKLAQKVGSATSTLIPEDGDFSLLQESETFAEPSRIGAEMGSIFKKAIVLTQGMKQDSQMKTANKLYKQQTWPCFNSQSSKYYGGYAVWKAMISTAGTNRQGVWFPKKLVHGGTPWVTQADLSFISYMSPMLLRMQIMDELDRYLLSPSIKSWLDEQPNASADLFYAINSITDTVTIGNAMKFSPVDLKIYICKCKSRTQWPPQSDWFNPTAVAQASEQLMNNDYVYAQTAGTRQNPAGGLPSGTIYGESSVHLGATPFYSPSFRESWEVVDVIKQQILPTDKFELTLHRKFRHAHSLRDMYAEFESMADGYFCEGDYGLIITYNGKPAYMQYTGTPAAGDLINKEVSASPSAISMISRSSINISAPNLFTSDMAPTSVSTDQYIAGEGRVLDTDLSTYNFTDTTWAIDVMTQVSQEVGGER
jgi:hypothetical protein